MSCEEGVAEGRVRYEVLGGSRLVVGRILKLLGGGFSYEGEWILVISLCYYRICNFKDAWWDCRGPNLTTITAGSTLP